MSEPARPLPLTYSLLEAAQKLGVSEKVLRAELRAGNIRCVVIGARRRFTDQDIDEFLERKRMLCPSDAGRGRRTTSMTSRSKVVGFAEAVRQQTATRRFGGGFIDHEIIITDEQAWPPEIVASKRISDTRWQDRQY